MKKVSELEAAELDYHVARAEGAPADELEIRPTFGVNYTGNVCVRRSIEKGWPVRKLIDYSTNWAMAGPLAEKWADHPMMQGTNWNVVMCCGDPLIAICRAVVLAAFGDEV